MASEVRSLAQRSAAAAQSLREQVDALLEAVGSFTLGGEVEPAHPPTAIRPLPESAGVDTAALRSAA